MSLLEFEGRLRYPSGFHIDAAFTLDTPVTALFGPSGSGKSSILSMIAGLRRPDAGRIAIGNRVVFCSQTGTQLPPESRGVGYVFQDHLLFPHLSVRKNLLYGWRRRRPGSRALELDRVVALLELSELLERLPHTLSGGQRQRVALGRALLSGPDLLLLDEPLASVDHALRKRVLETLDQILQQWRIPTLYVTHDWSEVEQIASQVVTLELGRVVSSSQLPAAQPKPTKEVDKT
jgi:molybdate transport system ATP-binding protein